VHADTARAYKKSSQAGLIRGGGVQRAVALQVGRAGGIGSVYARIVVCSPAVSNSTDFFYRLFL
jgi:hypothetical protein